MKRACAALAICALMVPSAAAWVVSLAKFDDAECSVSSSDRIAVAPSAVAFLVSEGLSNDASCFSAGKEGGFINLGHDDSAGDKCTVVVYKGDDLALKCDADQEYPEKKGTAEVMEEKCVELPDNGYAKIGCFAAAPSGVSDFTSYSDTAAEAEILKLTRPAVEAQSVQGSVQVSGEGITAETFDKLAFAKALAKTLGVAWDVIDVEVDSLPLTRRRLLGDNLYVMYTIPVEDEAAAEKLNTVVNEDPAALAETFAENLAEEGVVVDEIVVEEATATVGTCGNLCQETTYKTKYDKAFWERKKINEKGEVKPLGASMFGFPRLVPMNSFEEYEGSFDITNMEYLQSTAFMGIIGYAMSFLMLVLILLNLLWHIIRPFCCCCKNKAKKIPKELKGWHKYMPMVCMFLFTGVAVLGCLLIYAGAPKLTGGVGALLDVISDEVDVLGEQTTLVQKCFNDAAESLEDLSFLKKAGDGLAKAVDTVDEMVDDAKADLNNYIKQANTVFLIMACVFLGVVVMTTLAGECSWLFLLHIFKHLAHLLTVIAWLLFGISMTTAVVMDDLCSSMGNYLEDPETSNLDKVMPCLDPATAVETMNKAREGITDAMDEIQGPGTGFGSMVAYNNRLFGNMQPLCEPFTRTTVEEVCAKNSDDFLMYDEQVCKGFHAETIEGDAEAFVTSECTACCTPLRKFGSTYGDLDIPEDQLKLAIDGVNAADALRLSQPPIESLLNCEFVTKAFHGMVHGKTCAGLTGGLELFTLGMALVAVGYTLLWVTWNIADHHIEDRRKRLAAKKAGKSIEMA